MVLLVFIGWIVIYPVDSAIHRLNNWGQVISHSQVFKLIVATSEKILYKINVENVKRKTALFRLSFITNIPFAFCGEVVEMF